MSFEILTGEKRITRIIRTFLSKYSYAKRQTSSPSLHVCIQVFRLQQFVQHAASIWLSLVAIVFSRVNTVVIYYKHQSPRRVARIDTCKG